MNLTLHKALAVKASITLTAEEQAAAKKLALKKERFAKQADMFLPFAAALVAAGHSVSFTRPEGSGGLIAVIDGTVEAFVEEVYSGGSWPRPTGNFKVVVDFNTYGPNGDTVPKRHYALKKEGEYMTFNHERAAKAVIETIACIRSARAAKDTAERRLANAKDAQKALNTGLPKGASITTWVGEREYNGRYVERVTVPALTLRGLSTEQMLAAVELLKSAGILTTETPAA